MKLFAPGLVLLLSSCTVHNHYHAPAAPAATRSAPSPDRSHASGWTAQHGTVSGIVVDSGGNPTRARIAAVIEGGSNTTSTDERGRFTLRTPSDHYVLNASTEGGLIALTRGQSDSGVVELTLRPGGILVIDLAGREKSRCAVFAQNLRAEDFTLQAGREVRVAVPVGTVRVLLYEGNDVLAEQSFDIRVGESKVASFKIGA